MAKRILIIDDEPDLVKVCAFRLKKAGFEVWVAVNGKEALDLLQKEIPDLILLDLRLPLISGYDVCKKIKSDDKLRQIPVILFTASVDLIADKVRDSGADDYLTKPFEPEILLAKIKGFLGQA